MKKRPIATLPSYYSPLTSSTGHHCPITGWWRSAEDLEPRFISEGDVMPAANGTPTQWTLHLQRGMRNHGSVPGSLLTH
jgi:hypothetical protein